MKSCKIVLALSVLVLFLIDCGGAEPQPQTAQPSDETASAMAESTPEADPKEEDSSEEKVPGSSATAKEAAPAPSEEVAAAPEEMARLRYTRPVDGRYTPTVS